jgi:uncharacterized protein (TIGR03382 family)
MISLLLIAAPALAGYGDVVDGLPSWEERDLHLWTNAVRVDPEAFEAEYQAAGCGLADFKPGEDTPKGLLYYDHDLNDASRVHCEDMRDNNHFAHESSDGTSFFDRVAKYYTETSFVGENIAYGYSDGYVAVTQGWMCSSGHRENIMRPEFTELGTGVASTYYTQDFAAGSPNWEAPVAMGAHSPRTATDEATFRVDWQHAEAPAQIAVVVDGEAWPMELEFGVAEQGVYVADASPDAIDCHQYWFSWKTAEGKLGGFPETGSYTYGQDCSVDWVEGQKGGGAGAGGGDGAEEVPEPDYDFPLATAGDVDGDPKLIGCSSAPGVPAAGLLGALAALAGGRRRRR